LVYWFQGIYQCDLGKGAFVWPNVISHNAILTSLLQAVLGEGISQILSILKLPNVSKNLSELDVLYCSQIVQGDFFEAPSTLPIESNLTNELCGKQGMYVQAILDNDWNSNTF
jgi:hypothetical protein